MADKNYYDLGNEAFVSEEFEEALKYYKSGIELNANADSCYAGASQVYLKENKFQEALYHANQAVKLNSKNQVAHLRKGIALFNLGKVLDAQESFQEALKFKADDKKVIQWLSKCTESSNSFNQKFGRNSMLSQPKYDWYQSESDVVVTVLVKDVHPEDVIYEITNKLLDLVIKHRQGLQFHLKIHTCHDIIPEESKLKFLPARIEVKLKKAEGVHWERLDKSGISNIQGINANEVGKKSSNLFKTDWDKLVCQVKEEEKNEELEGEAALNRLFQQIYADGSDDVKKAMLKSYTESGGTVLSTNWNEIGKEKVDMQPPEGMEFKKWSS